MIIIYVIIFALLIMIIFFLSFSLYYLVKKTIYLSTKEKEYITFVANIFEQYGNELGIQSKEQHTMLVNELNKIKSKLENKN